MQKNETRPPSYTTHKNKFKIDQRLKCQNQNHKNCRENIGSEISDIAHSNILSDISLQARETKEKKINKWDYIKLKSFCTAKEIINKIKTQPTEWENIFANTSDKGLISQNYKVRTKLNTRITNNSIKNWANT